VLQNFVICANAVIPSAIYLIIGILLRVCKVVTEAEVKRFTHMTFVALYPFMMFENIYGKNLGENMNGRLVLYAIGFVLLQIAVSWAFVCGIEKDNYNRGAMIQAMYRSNYVLMGLPIAINLLGKANVTPVAVVLLFIVPIYNIVAVIVFEYFRGGKVNYGILIKNVLTNPIILGGLAAGVLMLFNITLPKIVNSTVVSLSDCTAPIAMILLGASLTRGSISADRAKVAICVAAKLLLWPAIGIGGAVLLGLRGVEIVAIALMVGTPTALASYAMASSMGGNGELAGECIVFSTILACFTLPMWLFVLLNNGLF